MTFCPHCHEPEGALHRLSCPTRIRMPSTQETRVTDPDTGGQKGSKPAQASMIPAKALLDLATVYGVGAEKYDRDNWRRGYRWSLSFDALQRHLWAFWGGEDTDPESGLPHLSHAAWHVFALMTFADEHPEKDDRCSSERSPSTRPSSTLSTRPAQPPPWGAWQRPPSTSSPKTSFS